MKLEIKKIEKKIELDTKIQNGCKWCLQHDWRNRAEPIPSCFRNYYNRSTNPNPWF